MSTMFLNAIQVTILLSATRILSRHRSAIHVSCFQAMDGVLMCERLCAGLRGVTTAGARWNHRNISLATDTHHQHIVHRKPGQNRAFCTVNKVS